MEQIEQIAKNDLDQAPARKVLRLLGEAAVMSLTGLSSEALRKWKRRKASGGCGGLVPSQYQNRILEAAQVRGLELTADDFIAEPY